MSRENSSAQSAIIRKELPFKNSFLYGVFGPAIVLLAFGQATGELIHWPYLVSKYGEYFMFILLPATLLQLPMFFYLARHTLLTGESYLTTLFRANWAFSILTWAIFIITSIWISSYTASGSVALIKGVNSLFGTTFDLQESSAVVTILATILFYCMLLFGGNTYLKIRKGMLFVSGLSLVCITVVFVVTVAQNGLKGHFFNALFDYKWSLPENWIPSDAKLLVSAIVFTGLGGLWNILYSIWLRNERAGMAHYQSDPAIDGFEENDPISTESAESNSNYKKWMRLIYRDLAIGVVLNIVMLVMLAYVAFAGAAKSLSPAQGLGIITVLADTAKNLNVILGFLFYAFLAFFLMDTWLTATDALAKMHSNVVVCIARKLGVTALGGQDNLKNHRALYVFFISFMLVMTFVTTYVAQPQQLNYLNGVLSVLGTVILIIGIFINERFVSSLCPSLPKHSIWRGALVLSFLSYSSLAYLYYVN